MPHNMAFGGQSNKWFSVLILVVLPFIVFFKAITGQLPNIKDIRPE